MCVLCVVSDSVRYCVSRYFLTYFTTVHCSIVVVVFFIIQVRSYFFKCCVLILLVCACPVYHCVICVYAIRSLDRNFPINTYLLNVSVTLTLTLNPWPWKPNQYVAREWEVFMYVLVQISSVVHQQLSSQDFYGCRCVTLNFEPVTLKMSFLSYGLGTE